MERFSLRQRLKWAVAILCALLSPIAGMVVSACIFWRSSLIVGIAVGGIIGMALYFGILWRELKLKERWLNLVISVPLAFLIAYLLLRRYMPELAVLALIYIPVVVTLMPRLHELGKKPAPSEQKPSPTSARIGVVALTLLAAVAFYTGRVFPMVRPLTDGYLWIYTAAVLFGGIAFFGRIFFERGANGRWQTANLAYQKQCDTRPMLEECDRRLSKRLSKTAQQRWLMQKAAALADIGETESAIQIVDELLSAEQDLSVQTRWACFYDLAEFHCKLGTLEAAAVNRINAYACARQCVDLKTKQWMLDTLHAQEGVFLYHSGEYKQAKQRMRECGWDGEETDQALCTRVFHAYWIGLVFLKTGDTETAMEKLRFVAEHGNQLAVAAQAKEMIK